MQPNARSLEQILGELNSVYDPQIASLRQQQSMIPGQIAEEEKGLQAKQTQAFDDILGGARRRGLGFSGIPLGEQAKYTATEYLPALARLRQTGRQQAMSLEDAILGIQERRGTTAQQLYQQELSRAEQARQFNEQLAAQQRAAAAARAIPTLGAAGGGAQPAQQAKQYIGNDDFRGFLAWAASNGDQNAKVALKYAGNDARYDGPVSSIEELNALKQAGIQGNYYLAGTRSTGGSGLNLLSGAGNSLAGLRF